jgi:hypothetical protein
MPPSNTHSVPALYFQSRFFVPSVSRTHLFHAFLLKPFIYGLLALMVVCLFGMLQNRDALPLLMWGTAVWYGVLSLGTWQYLEKQIAQIVIQDEFVSITSPLHIQDPNLPFGNARLVTGFRTTAEGISVNFGETVYDFRRQDWDHPEILFEALRLAAEQGSNPVLV